MTQRLIKPQPDPYQRLAVHVIRQAVFEARSRSAADYSPKIAIEALEFLVEREDLIAVHWFALAGVSREVIRRSKSGLRLKAQLERLRQDKSAMPALRKTVKRT
jgi:hypothetical protein